MPLTQSPPPPPPIFLEIIGRPIAQPRHKVGRRGKKSIAYIDEKHPIHAWKDTVRKRATESKLTPLSGPLKVELRFRMPRPKGMFWKTKPMPEEPHCCKPDSDNLAKAVLDSLNGIAWFDDGQIAHLTIRKQVSAGGDQPGCDVMIEKV